MATIHEMPGPGEDIFTLSRGDLVKVLFNATKKFFNLRDHPERQITFKEVFLNNDLRCDVLNISWDNKVFIVEIKTCRADFVGDKKWKGYLDYCDYFAFLAPKGTIKQEELSEKVGLIEVTGYSEHPFVEFVKSPRKLKPLHLNNAWFNKMFKKLAFRRFAKVAGELIELDESRFF